MAAMLQFDLVSPERKLASVSATEVQIPGADGLTESQRAQQQASQNAAVLAT